MKLPWSYWPIMLVMLIICAAIAVMVGMLIDLNPYISALIGGGIYVLHETWVLKRNEEADNSRSL